MQKLGRNVVVHLVAGKILTLSAPCISESCIKIKINLKCLYSHFSVVPQKTFKAFIKPFEAPQRSVKIRI